MTARKSKTNPDNILHFDKGKKRPGDAQQANELDEAVARYLAEAREIDDPKWVLEEIEALLDFSPAQYKQAMSGLKALFGALVDLRVIKGEVNKARKKALVIETGSGLPVVDVTNISLRSASQLALNALLKANNPPSLFVRDGAIVRVTRNEKGRPAIRFVDDAVMRGQMTRSAEFVRLNDGKYKHLSPPIDIVRAVLHMSANAFPALSGITETPIVRPDGTIAVASGYDPATHLYLDLAKDLALPPIPARPTRDDAHKAALALDEVIGEFPFVSAADKANEIALMLTLVIRPAIRGIVPMADLSAPMPGTGKGLLAQVNSIIATGNAVATTPCPTNDEEWGKLIMSLLGDGLTVTLFDNVTGVLNSAKLDAVLTSPVYRDRVLGLGRTAAYEQRMTWMLTGNNVQFGSDTRRRIYQIRMNAMVSNPEDRTFKHAELIPWTREHRAEMLGALLTIIRAWYVAGKPAPEQPVKPMGSYEEWTDTLDGVLAYAGVEGFLGNQERVREQTTPETGGWESFFTAWHERFPGRYVKCSEVQDALVKDPKFLETLPDSLGKALDNSITASRTTLISNTFFTRPLGTELGRKKDVSYGPDNIRVEAGKKSDGYGTWIVCKREASTHRMGGGEVDVVDVSGTHPTTPYGKGYFVLNNTPAYSSAGWNHPTGPTTATSPDDDHDPHVTDELVTDAAILVA